MWLHHRSLSALYSDWPREERVSLPLFQYRMSPSSAAVVLHEYDLFTFSPKQITSMTEGELIVDTAKGVDAVRLWVEYDGMKMSAVGRSEVSLVGEALKTQVGTSGRVVVRSGFAASTGTFTVCVQSRFS